MHGEFASLPGAELVLKQSGGLFETGEETGLWPGAACKALRRERCV